MKSYVSYIVYIFSVGAGVKLLFTFLSFQCYFTKTKYMYYIQKYLCIPESFNTNISHQLFVNKITFVNSQSENTNLKADFEYSKPVWNVNFKDFWYTKINLSHKYRFILHNTIYLNVEIVILSSELFWKDEKYVFKARNLCCVHIGSF